LFPSIESIRGFGHEFVKLSKKISPFVTVSFFFRCPEVLGLSYVEKPMADLIAKVPAVPIIIL